MAAVISIVKTAVQPQLATSEMSDCWAVCPAYKQPDNHTVVAIARLTTIIFHVKLSDNLKFITVIITPFLVHTQYNILNYMHSL